MRKALALSLALCMLFLLGGCVQYQEDVWYSEEKLAECLVSDLPKPDAPFLNQDNWRIYTNLKNAEFEAYVQSVYDYLKQQSFPYLGTRGAYKSSLSIAFMSYYYQPTETLEQHCINGDYYFVYSDGSTDEGGSLIFWFLGIYRSSGTSCKYGSKSFNYNTQLTLRKGSEAPATGFYFYDEEHIDPCYFGHSYDAGIPCPLPGSANTLTLYTCQNCSYEKLSEFIGDMTLYKLIEDDASGRQYIKRHADAYASGVIVHIDTQKLIDADIILSVNGTVIPKEDLEDRWRYTFVMPCADAVITAEVVDGFLPSE